MILLVPSHTIDLRGDLWKFQVPLVPGDAVGSVETIKCPKTSSGWLRSFSIGRRLWFFQSPQAPEGTSGFQKSLWHLVIPLVTLVSFHDRGHIQTPQIPQVLVDAFGPSVPINHPKMESGYIRSACIKRYRWHMPAGFLGYLSTLSKPSKTFKLRRV